MLQVADGVHIRLLEEADAAELHALVEANRDRLARWMPWAANQTSDGTLEFIRRSRAQAAENDGLQSAVVVAGAIVGMAGNPGVSAPPAGIRRG